MTTDKIGPREVITRKLVCDGCPAFESYVIAFQYHARCAETGNEIDLPVSSAHKTVTPVWCPASKQKTT